MVDGRRCSDPGLFRIQSSSLVRAREGVNVTMGEAACIPLYRVWQRS